MGFRGKQIATLTLVAAAVALATSLVNLAALARLAVAEARSRAELLADNFYHQAMRVVRHGSDDLEEALRRDPSLATYAEGVVGYSPTVMYAALTGRGGKALVHSNPREEGDRLPRVPSLERFSERNPFAQLWALSQGHRVLEVSVPLLPDGEVGEPLGEVRVAISTLLLKEEIADAILRNALLSTLVVLVAFLASFFFANWLLKPIEMLRRELSRIATAPGEPPLDLRNESDVSRIAEFFSTMSQRLSEEKNSRENETGWLSTMLQGLSDAVIVISGEGRVLSLNAPAEKLLGRDLPELQGKSLSELLPPEHPVAQIATRALSLKEPVGPLNAEIPNNARRGVYALTAQVLRDTSGVSGVMVSARDLEKLSRLGSHLSYSQKLAALGKLTSGIAHEIKNPLNAMVIHVALLREKLRSAAPDARESLDTLDHEIRRLDRVIQGFLRFTRPEDLRLASIKLPELLEEVVRLVSAEAEAGAVDIVIDAASGLPEVYGDRELLQQAFLNLVRNACEAMPDGGRLELRACEAEDGVEIAVSDTGVGIDREMIEKIFDLYVTTKQSGSGIGLSMVYRIVQLHGGEITVESVKGAGARFTVRLPEAPA